MYKYQRQYTQQGLLSRSYEKKILRKKWLKAARRDMDVSPKSDLYCWEDHFKLTINYLGISPYNWLVTKPTLSRTLLIY
jgi:hypothetical protein